MEAVNLAQTADFTEIKRVSGCSDDGAGMLNAALDYVEKGFPVFPLWPNSKKPMVAHGFKAASIDREQIISWWAKTPDANIGIKTGAESGLVVLDVDVKNGVDGWKSLVRICEEHGEILPKTQSCLTPSGGYHFYFKHPGEMTANSASRIGEGLDVRGDGGYVVVPPSVIGGIPYAWQDRESSLLEMPAWIKPMAPRQGVTPSYEYGVPEGRRNDHIFRLACKLRGEGVEYEDALTQVIDEANRCVPPLPEEEAVKTLQGVYERYPAGIPVPDEIHELNKSHAVVMMGGKFRILNHETDPQTGLADVNFSPPNDFKNWYVNRFVETGPGKRQPLGTAWLESPARTAYKGITFVPGKKVEGYFNLWQGFAVERRRGDIDLFLNHIRENIAAGDEDVYNYVIGWMADVVQNPSELLGTSIVLRGGQGTGKGVLCNTFGSLFGKHYVHLANSRHLLGNFNAHLGEAVLVFADEAFWGGDKAAEGSLKALITEPTQIIEKKGYDATKVKNFVHLMVASNNDWVVPAGLDERRFLVLDVSNRHQQDHDYFKAIMQQIENGGREALLDYLLSYDLSTVNLRKLPKTKALMETQLLSMSHGQKFWHSKLQQGALDATLDHWNGGEILCSKFQDDYMQFVRDIGGKHKGTAHELGNQIRKLVPPGFQRVRQMIEGRREYLYRFPSLEECRAHFDKLMNVETEWEGEGVAVKPVAYPADEPRVKF